MIRIVLNGAAGRMGKTIIQVMSNDNELKLVGAIEAKNSPNIGKDSGELAGIGQNNIIITSNIEEVINDADVIIDFSSPDSLVRNIDCALKYNVGLVIGTTGIKNDDIENMKEASKFIPIIWSPNFSVGITLLSKIVKLCAEILNDGYDVEIVEAHHRMKKDAPSGTAIKLLNILKEVYRTNDVVCGRNGLIGERPKNQIGVSVVRGGDIIGEHSVLFLGNGERLELTHKATSRETFARGALKAAKFIYHKGKGFYTMEQVLGL